MRANLLFPLLVLVACERPEGPKDDAGADTDTGDTDGTDTDGTDTGDTVDPVDTETDTHDMGAYGVFLGRLSSGARGVS